MSTMTISDLRTRRADTWEKAKAFLDERRDTTTGCLSAEDDQTYARMEADIEQAHQRDCPRRARPAPGR
ncbi:hypothetical protein PV375_05510 [Gulosibacter sp. GYB002]|uniref:hypothetical protein n=1 Tax=Gulosibacter sp. GYB002 TaxID=2994391 RepID=UPI002F9643A6